MLARSAHPAPRSFRRLVAAAAVALLALGASACGSDSDSGDGASDGAVATDAAATEVSTPAEPADTEAPVATEGEPSPECNGLSAADVGAAAGGDFDSADDVSVDADVSCLFSDSTTGDSVVVLREGTATFLAGSLDDTPSDEALTVLEASYTTVMDDATAERTTIGGSPAVVVTGTSAIAGTPVGYAATIIDGELVEVSSDGSGLSADAAGFGPIVTAVLELAVAAQG